MKTYAHTTCNNRYKVETGNNFTMSDNTGTPQTSPLAYSTTEIELKVPDNAVEIVMRPTTDIRVKTSTGASDYYVLQAGTTEVFWVAELDSIFFIRDAAGGVLNFRFITL